MACIVYQTNKRSGYVYAYHAVPFRDPQSKCPKSKRTYIGRVDPDTKEFLDPKAAAQKLSQLEPISGLTSPVQNQEVENDKILEELQGVKKELGEIKSLIMRKDSAVQAIRDALDTYILT